MSDHSDTTSSASGTKTLLHALKLGAEGYPVFPCKPFSKAPATENGFKDASTDEAQIRAWFGNKRGFNLAVRCGACPNGVNLLAVDIDPKNGGVESWAALVAQHGTPLAPRHETPSGGFHLFFDTPEAWSSVHSLGAGIDTRGEGGYVVVPPSRLVNDDGEIIVYATKREVALVENRPSPPPAWVRPPSSSAVQASKDRHPSVGSGPGPLDRVRDGWVWESELLADGWSVEGRSGGDVRFTRPGKSPREGHSASLGPNSGLRVFTETRPPGGKPMRQGSGVTFSPGEYVLEYRCGGEWREFFRRYPDPDPKTAAVRAVPPAPPDAPLFPPLDWYDQRPWMQACRQMAQAVGGSPSAHLLAFLARWATLIPPGYSIPPINGAPSSFDLLGVIAGTSGSGKTSPMRNAAELLPVARTDLRLGLGIGSGEGIIEAFYGMKDVVGDDGKKRRERAKVVAGVNFSVSEGLIFAELAGRGGTTHVTRLCDAWSGAALSTANASAETFRHIDVNQYRLTLVMGIQADMAHELMNDSAASQGFVGRLLFAWAEEPRVKPRPRPPERPILPVPAVVAAAGTYTQTYLSYPDEVYAECQDAADARVGSAVAVEDHHHDLLRCKIAGIVALMDGRLAVSLDDWALATTLVSCSANVRNHLYAHRRQSERDRRHRQAEARAEVEITVEDVKDRQAIARMAEAIKRSAEGGIALGALRKKVSSATTRHRFEPALALAVANGWVRVEDGRVEAV